MRFSVFFFCVVLVGCGSNHSVPINVVTNPSGNWTGMLNSVSAQNSRTIDLFITQSGNSLSAQRVKLGITKALHLCDFNGTMSGTATSGQVTMSLLIPPNPPIPSENMALTGTLQGSTISGSYSETSGCINGDSGTFQLSPVTSVASSQWSGTWSDSFGASGPASANLVEDSSGSVTGTLTIVGTGGCSGLVSGAQNVTGTQTGLAVDLTTIVTVGLQLTVGGLVDASGKQITIGNPCGTVIQNGNYTITLTRPQ